MYYLFGDCPVSVCALGDLVFPDGIADGIGEQVGDGGAQSGITKELGAFPDEVVLTQTDLIFQHLTDGSGSFLLDSVIRSIEQAGYREITVGVEDDNARARRMYKKRGFTERVARCSESYQGDAYEYDLLLRRRAET